MDGWCEVRRNFISAKSNLELLVRSVCAKGIYSSSKFCSTLWFQELPVNSLCLLSYWIWKVKRVMLRLIRNFKGKKAQVEKTSKKGSFFLSTSTKSVRNGHASLRSWSLVVVCGGIFSFLSLSPSKTLLLTLTERFEIVETTHRKVLKGARVGGGRGLVHILLTHDLSLHSSP